MGYIFILEICGICRYVEGRYTDVCPRYGDLFHEDMSSLLHPGIGGTGYTTDIYWY